MSFAGGQSIWYVANVFRLTLSETEVELYVPPSTLGIERCTQSH
jgi:hypothetical protein